VLLVIIYQVLKQGTKYAELGAEFLERLEPARLTRQLVKRLEALGNKVTLEPLRTAWGVIFRAAASGRRFTLTSPATVSVQPETTRDTGRDH
jgi:hypothetical protein